MTTEDKIQSQNLPAAQISLTDCLACSGCVTSAEAVLVSLQSHAEVVNALNSSRSIRPEELRSGRERENDKIFVASVSPQTRASLAAAYGVSERAAGNMIQQMLSGSRGIRRGTKDGSDFLWVIDTNVAREACLVLGADEVMNSMTEEGTSTGSDGAATRRPQRPVLTSACPGWICYAEKTHPHILRHLSRLKSPQALLGTLVKTTLSRILTISPEKIWHLAIMPCFDKKLEASREELTDIYWSEGNDTTKDQKHIRDVDCVITTKELLLLADSTGINFSDLPQDPISPTERIPFPDPTLDGFLFPSVRQIPNTNPAGGTSGGYLYHILETFVAQNPGGQIHTHRGRNSDIVEHQVIRDGQVLLKTARYYGFRNIQNLVRKLKPPKTSRMPIANRKKTTVNTTNNGSGTSSSTEYAYIEVMACPGGCTNGGGQIKIDEVASIQSNIIGPETTTTNITTPPSKPTPADQRKWLNQVDEAYFSSSSSPSSSPPSSPSSSSSSRSSSNSDFNDESIIGGISHPSIHAILHHWSEVTNIPLERLVYTSYRAVESDVGKDKGGMMAVEGLAGKVGGGW